MANSEAKICADAIVRAFNGEAPDEDIATSSACFSRSPTKRLPGCRPISSTVTSSTPAAT